MPLEISGVNAQVVGTPAVPSQPRITQGIGQGVGSESIPLVSDAVGALSINSVTLTPIEDSGDGTVAGDMNASSGAGWPFTVEADMVVIVLHKTVAYSYVATEFRPHSLGVGGSYTTVAGDYAAVGTVDHDLLTNKDSADQHPQASITNLVADQTTQNNRLTAVEGRATTLESRADTTDSEQTTQDNRLTAVEGRTTTLESRADNTDSEQVTQDNRLTAIESEQVTQNTRLQTGETWRANHVDPGAIPNPHTQYKQIVDQHGIVLFGTVNDGAIGTGTFFLTGYTEQKQWDFDTPADISQAAGSITIPRAGTWKITIHVTGDQGNDIKEEQMAVGLDVDGIQFLLSAFDVATDKTSGRSFNASVTRNFVADAVLRLYMTATAGMGTFSFSTVSFEAHLRAPN